MFEITLKIVCGGIIFGFVAVVLILIFDPKTSDLLHSILSILGMTVLFLLLLLYSIILTLRLFDAIAWIIAH